MVDLRKMRTKYVVGFHIVTPKEAAAHTIEIMGMKPQAIAPPHSLPQVWINDAPTDTPETMLCGNGVVLKVDTPLAAGDMVSVFFDTAVTTTAKTFVFEAAMNDTKNLAVRFAGFVRDPET